MKRLALLIPIVWICSSCSWIVKWQEDYPDNAFEEAIEDYIKEKTGYDIDLTPFTGDEKQGDLKSK